MIEGAVLTNLGWLNFPAITSRGGVGRLAVAYAVGTNAPRSGAEGLDGLL